MNPAQLLEGAASEPRAPSRTPVQHRGSCFVAMQHDSTTTESPRAARLIGLRPTGRGSGLQNRRMGFDSPQPCARQQMPQRAPDHASDPGMDRRAGTGLTVKWPLDQHSGPADSAEMPGRTNRTNSTVTCSFAGRAIVQQRHCAHQRSVTRTDSSAGRAFGSHPKSPWFESRFVHLQVHQL